MASRSRLGKNDNSMAERRLRPIYGSLIYTILIFSNVITYKMFPEWIDNGNYKKALHELDKLIKKLPSQNCSKVSSRCLDDL